MIDVTVTRRAMAQIRAANAWWARNRPAAPNVLVEELERVSDLLAAQPEIGALAPNVRSRGVRHILLSRTRCYLYYRVRAERIEMLAL